MTLPPISVKIYYMRENEEDFLQEFPGSRMY